MASPTIWDEDYSCFVHGAAIADPTGGTVIDTQARSVIVSLLAAARIERIIGFDANTTVNASTSPPATVFDPISKCHCHASAVTTASGGTTIDTQLRAAVEQCRSAMTQKGILAGGIVAPQVFDPVLKGYTHSAYTPASGGTTIDVEGRAAIASLAAALQSHGTLSN